MTEQAQQAENSEAPEQTDESFRLLVESVKDYGIYMLDPEGYVTSWNAGAERIKGYTAEEIIGQHFSCFFPPEDVEAGKPERELEIAKAEGRYIDEGWRVRKDGTRFWAYVAITALYDHDGKPRGFGKVTRDMTERKQVEEEIRRLNTELEERVVKRTAQLEAANKELEAFSYSVSHDLRSPLRAVNGFSRILQEDYAEILPEDGQELLTLIQESAGQMGQLIDDLLAFSRLGRQPLNRQQVELREVIERAFKELHEDLQDRQVDINVGELPPCYCDTALITQLVINLLSNAIKFTRHREVARIEIGAYVQEDEQVYYVRDNGAGFDMRHADKLFGVFQRLHLPEEYEGTGVGLALVQRIALRHGGRVWADGEPDQGATFYVALPRMKGKERDR